jgi:hypothetical protein
LRQASLLSLASTCAAFKQFLQNSSFWLLPSRERSLRSFDQRLRLKIELGLVDSLEQLHH